MLAELLLWLITPASWPVRRMGYLAESVAIAARHRRCRAAWQPHLDASQQTVWEFSSSLTRRRTLVVLGSGAGYDLPLEALAKAWQKILLVDLIHPWAIRRRAARLANVHLTTWDIAGVADSLWARPNALPQPQPRWPLPGDCDALVSLNLMAQLPIVPIAYLRRHGWSEERLMPWGQSVVAAHWQHLVAAGCPALLITDVAAHWRCVAGKGRSLHLPPRAASSPASPTGSYKEHTLFGFRLPKRPFRHWQWQIAPPGEVASGIEKVLTVVAVRVSER